MGWRLWEGRTEEREVNRDEDLSVRKETRCGINRKELKEQFGVSVSRREGESRRVVGDDKQ